jgi:hypothetical protein
MPLSLSDDEYFSVMSAAAPIDPHQRDDFLRSLADELARHSVVGPGLVHRLAAALQVRFVVEARTQAESAKGPCHRGPLHQAEAG